MKWIKCCVAPEKLLPTQNRLKIFNADEINPLVRIFYIPICVLDFPALLLILWFKFLEIIFKHYFS